MDTIEQFLQSLGCEHPPKHYTPGEWINLPAPGKKPSNRSAGLFIDPDGQSATLKLHTTGETHYWRADRDDDYRPTAAERERAKRATEAHRRQTRHKHGNAAAKAKRYVDACKPATGHPYATDHGITDSELEYLTRDNRIVIPGYVNGRLTTYQTIAENGDKLYLKGGEKTGAVHQIGPDDDSDLEMIGEGWATSARGYQATGQTTITVFDTAGIKNHQPAPGKTRLIILVDNDRSGAGQAAADALQKRLSVERPEIAVVQLVPPMLPDAIKGTDWADHNDATIRKYYQRIVWPVVHIDQKYLKADNLQQARVTTVRSGMGTGKSFAARQIMKAAPGNRNAYMTPIIALCKNIHDECRADGIRITLHNDPDAMPGDTGNDVFCLNSAPKYGGIRYDHFFADEIEQSLSALVSRAANGMIKDPIEVLDSLFSIMRNASYVTLMDANAGPLTAALVEMAEMESTIVRNDYKACAGLPAIIHSGNMDEAIDEIKATIEAGGSVWCVCAEKRDAEKLHEIFGGTLHTGDTKPDNEILMTQAANGERITGHRFLTTAVGTGISVKEGTHDYALAVAIAKVGDTLPAIDSIVQGLRRPRGAKRVVCYMPNYKPRELETDPTKVQKLLDRQTARLRQNIETVDCDGRLMKLWAIDQAQRNRELNNPLETLRAALSAQGYDVEVITHDKPGKKHKSALRAAGKAVHERKVSRIENAIVPTRARYKAGIDDPITQTIARVIYDLRMTDEAQAKQACIYSLGCRDYFKGVARGDLLYSSTRDELLAMDTTAAQNPNPFARKWLTNTRDIQLALFETLRSELQGGEFSPRLLEMNPALIDVANEHGQAFSQLIGRRFGNGEGDTFAERVSLGAFVKAAFVSAGIQIYSRRSNGETMYRIGGDARSRQRVQQIQTELYAARVQSCKDSTSYKNAPKPREPEPIPDKPSFWDRLRDECGAEFGFFDPLPG